MEKVFLSVLNMSLTASFVILAIILVRMPLKKAPKIISYALWAVAGFRLISPFTLESVYSLLPFNAAPIPQDIAMQEVPRIDSGIPFVNNAVSSVLPAATPAASVNPLQIWLAVSSYIWLFGVIAMLIYSLVSIALLKRRLQAASPLEGNLYEADNLKTPFVIGLFMPKIYIPAGLSEEESRYIILHERTHIRRNDHVVKMFAYLVLCLHWFNPFAWAAFVLMGADMEMSCDERVMKELGEDIKNAYSLSLVRVAAGHKILNGSPLAFGEGGMKERIKNVLNFKKHSRRIIVVAVALVVVLSVGFAVSRSTSPKEPPKIIIQYDGNEINWIVGKNKWNGSIYDREDNFKLIMSGTTTGELPYIKNGEDILIQLEGDVPDSAMLSEYILRENGEVKYNMGTSYNLRFGILNRKGDFTLLPNPNTLLSSYSGDYVPGNTIKGYRLVCTWGGNECEYGFIIRSDAAFTVNQSLSNYETREWVNYYLDNNMPWNGSLELELPEYPDTVFQWTPYEVTATHGGGKKKLFEGMPIWNVYLADLTDDGFPEFCATVSIGSGIIDQRVVVFDYVNDKLYDLSDRMYYDYVLSMEDGQLIVTQTEFNGRPSDGAKIAVGSLAIVKDELIAIGIDRTRPEVEPEVTSAPTEDMSDISQRVEDGLRIIMSSPLTSSNPQDYIDAHQEEYEKLTMKYPDGVLEYLISQFEAGNSDGLRGQIMMRMCKEMLGAQNNVTDESLSPQEWYEQLSIISETKLPDFKPENPEGQYGGLIYSAITQHYAQSDDGFLVAAPTVYGTYEEEGKLKIFVTVFYERYKLYGKTLESTGGGVIPGAIVFRYDKHSGGWEFEEYFEVGSANLPDGAYFGDSIRKLCVMPVSGKEIPNLAKKMNSDYSDDTRRELLMQNLKEHLMAYGQTDVSIRKPDGSLVKLSQLE